MAHVCIAPAEQSRQSITIYDYDPFLHGPLTRSRKGVCAQGGWGNCPNPARYSIIGSYTIACCPDCLIACLREQRTELAKREDT